VVNGCPVVCCLDSSKGRLERLVADLWRGHFACRLRVACSVSGQSGVSEVQSIDRSTEALRCS
jgi:hypothetical protein